MKTTKNKYIYPVELNKNVRITYNESPAHIGRLKYAVDFIVPENTEIKAAQDGIVIDIKQDSNFYGSDESYEKHGNYIEIQHSNNEYSIYEHIKQNGAKIKVGDNVKEGQIIGYSGNTGWMANLGSHLHFDVHKYFGNNPKDYESLKITWKK